MQMMVNDRQTTQQTFANQPSDFKAFVEHSDDSFYMCSIEVHDFDGLKARLNAAWHLRTGLG